MFERRKGAGWVIHPGEILKEEFLVPLGMSEYALAKAIGVTPQRVNDITKAKSGISADMAMRLGKFFASSPEFWMNLQSSFELSNVQAETRKTIAKIVPLEREIA